MGAKRYATGTPIPEGLCKVAAVLVCREAVNGNRRAILRMIRGDYAAMESAGA